MTVGNVTVGNVTVGSVTVGNVTVGNVTVGTVTVGNVTIGSVTVGVEIDGIVCAWPSEGASPPAISASTNPQAAARNPTRRTLPARRSCRARTDRRAPLIVA